MRPAAAAVRARAAPSDRTEAAGKRPDAGYLLAGRAASASWARPAQAGHGSAGPGLSLNRLFVTAPEALRAELSVNVPVTPSPSCH